MLESLLPYYERELSYLRDLSSEFARRYPKVAARLALEGGQSEDPHVERLIESFAFLGARIHRKLDDEFPEITSSFLEVMYPHYLQPIPAATIVQFETNPMVPEMQGRYHIPRGEAVHSPVTPDGKCTFRTCYPVDVFPMSLTGVRLELTSASAYLRQLSQGAAAVLTLELETWAALRVADMDIETLRFFLDGDSTLMHLLHELLLTSAMRVRVGSGGNSNMTDLPGTSIAPVGFAANEAMLEYDKRSFIGYRLLTEYFNFPEKFLFVDFLHLKDVTSRMEGQRLVLQVILNRYPSGERHHRLLTELKAHHFKLSCSPVINLFAQAGEPIRVTHQDVSYPVRVNVKQEGIEVVQIKRVTRVEVSAKGEESDAVPPFYSILHGDAAVRFYWHATREVSTERDDKGTDLDLYLVDLDFEPVRPAGEVLSLELLCSNRDAPTQIPFGGSEQGQISDFELPGQTIIKRVRLLRKPTPSQRLFRRRGLQWRLISHLSLNYLSLIEQKQTGDEYEHDKQGAHALREMLMLYSLNASPVMLRQIKGITSIESRPAVTRVSGPDFSGFVRGVDITLTLDEDAYVGGSVYLFASVLERFFALYCAINSFTRLHVRTKQQQEEVLTWPARSGENLVI
jgi:type VI secretion system protein ImpG